MKTKSIDEIIPAQSMILSYNNAEIFFLALDGLNVYTEIAKEKFNEDIKIINRDSSPNLVSINLHDTLLDNDLSEFIINNITQPNIKISKLAFVGINRIGKNIIKKKLKSHNIKFVYTFINDYEKSKEWLVSKR